MCFNYFSLIFLTLKLMVKFKCLHQTLTQFSSLYYYNQAALRQINPDSCKGLNTEGFFCLFVYRIEKWLVAVWAYFSTYFTHQFCGFPSLSNREGKEYGKAKEKVFRILAYKWQTSLPFPSSWLELNFKVIPVIRKIRKCSLINAQNQGKGIFFK